MKILFICNQGKNRSKTAEELFKDKFETKSCGLFDENSVAKEQLLWADLVVVMEDFQRGEIGKRFPEEYLKKRIICFGIGDFYYYMQPELIELLKEKFNSAILEIA